MSVIVNTAQLELRTAKLTKSILNQIPKVDRIPATCMDKGHFIPDKVVGWIHGSVLGDSYQTIFLLKLSEGEYVLYLYPGDGPRADYKQIYIV